MCLRDDAETGTMEELRNVGMFLHPNTYLIMKQIRHERSEVHGFIRSLAMSEFNSRPQNGELGGCDFFGCTSASKIDAHLR